SLYHISAGHRAACTFGEIDEAFARANGAAPVGERYRKVEVDDLKELAKSFESRIGPANPRLVLRALRLYSGFADLNYLFDNSRLLEEGISAPPRFTDYLDVCVQSSSAVSIPAQMQWDFK
ncbi:NAD(P)H-binding protein, partial [Pseudomonas aeruginosa]